jgi:hypothetical protein
VRAWTSGDWWFWHGNLLFVLDEEGSISVGNLEAVFCRIDVISEFAASAKDCGEIFLSRSWACSF